MNNPDYLNRVLAAITPRLPVARIEWETPNNFVTYDTSDTPVLMGSRDFYETLMTWSGVL